MNGLSHAEKKIKKMYRSEDTNVYYYRFFVDLFTNLSYDLGDKSDKNKFYSIEPKGCLLEKILEIGSYDFSYDWEEIINNTLRHLARCGKAYIYLIPEYKNIKKIDGTMDKNISSLKVGEIVGYPQKVLGGHTVFYALRFGGAVVKEKIEPERLIVLDVRDLGYGKREFYKMVERLGKSKNAMLSTKFITGSVKEYDFSAHVKKDRFRSLRILKDVGWHLSNEGLSDSYILFKKIQQDKLQMAFLEYVMKQINDGIKAFLKKDDVGEIVFHLRNLDYDRLWDDFTKGKTTITELNKILYQV